MGILLDMSVGFTLYHYIFLRRVNNAINNCGDYGNILPQKIYCALAITSPRTRELFTPEEKQIYLSGIILVNGYYIG